MTWLQIRFETSKQQAEQISDALETIGAISVTLQDARDEPVLEPGVGETPLWSHTIVSALFDNHFSVKNILSDVKKRIAPQPIPPYRISSLEDQQWERVWMDDFHPLQFGTRTWIVPSWEHISIENAVCVKLDPGLAFGTGTHPTTKMCLDWLDRNIKTHHTIIDYGCGSGILAITALCLGAKYAWAIDNDPQAILATDSNATNNQVRQKLTITPPDTQVTIRADIVIANILAGPLIELSALFKHYVLPGGYIVLSGILDSQLTQVHKTYSTWCNLQPPIHIEGWACLVGKKSQENP